MATIGNSFIPTRDILNSVSGKHQNISKLSKGVHDALDNVTTGQKYSSRAELDATGLSSRFDNAHAVILKAEANKTTVQMADSKLKAQQQALFDINAVMVEFEQPRDAAAAGTKAEKADRALTEIERIMRNKNQSGEYIFGGNDPFVDPLSFIDPAGNRVSVSLKSQSNVVNGKVLVNNYSDASADVTVVTASSAHEVKQGFLNAGMDSMVKTIGYLNMVKTGVVDAGPGGPAVTLEDIAAAQLAQKDGRGETSVLVNLEIHKLEDARGVNSSDIKAASETLKEFKGDLVELIGRAGDLLKSFVASISIVNAGEKAFDTLLQNTRI